MAGAYTLGIVDGPIVAAVGGLALVTLGRSMLVDGSAPLVAAAGLGLVAAATGVAAIRWGTLEVAELQGAQAVLGASVATGGTTVVAWSIVAALGGAAGVYLWTLAAPAGTRLWSTLESTLLASALVVAFVVFPLATTLVGTVVLACTAAVVAIAARLSVRLVGTPSPAVAAVVALAAFVATAAAATGITLVR